MVGQEHARQPRKSCFKTNPVFCQITAVYIWGAGQAIEALHCSCSCCCLVNGYAFMVSASSLDESRWVQRWKMGKKIQCSGIEPCAWSTWDHLSWWPIPRKCFSPGVFLYTLDDHVQLSRSSGQQDVPVSLWFLFSLPQRHLRYSSCAAPRGCSLTKPSWQLFQVVRGNPEVPWFLGCVTFCWHFSCSTGLSHLPVVISSPGWWELLLCPGWAALCLRELSSVKVASA